MATATLLGRSRDGLRKSSGRLGSRRRDRLDEPALDGARWITQVRLIAEGVAIAAFVVLAHLVPPAELGALALALVVREVALAAANATIAAPLVQRRAIGREHLEAATFAALCGGIGLMLVLLVLAPIAVAPLLGDRAASLLRLCALGFPFAAAAIVPAAQLRRQRALRRIGEVEIAGVATFAALSVILALAGFDAEAYVLGMLAGMAVSAAVLSLSAPPILPRWRPDELYELVGIGLPAASPPLVGFRYRARTLGVESESPIGALAGDQLRTHLVVVWPVLAFAVVVAPVIVPWLLGERWDVAVLPVQILALGGMATAVRSGIGPALRAAGAPARLARFGLAEAGLYAATILIAATYGLTAACIAMAGFQVLALAAGYAFLLRAPVERLLLDVAPAGVCSLVLLAATLPPAWVLEGWLPVLPWLAVTGAVAAVAYMRALRWAFPGAFVDLAVILERLLGGPRLVVRTALVQALALAGPPATRGLRRLRELFSTGG